jgi:hypothetical protein
MILALLGLSTAGWPSVVQASRAAVPGSPGEQESQSEDEETDSSDSDLEAHLMYGRSSRKRLLAQHSAVMSERMREAENETRRLCVIRGNRIVATISTTVLPLRC